MTEKEKARKTVDRQLYVRYNRRYQKGGETE